MASNVPSFGPTDRTRVRQVPQRARYDRETIYAILDEALVCHVGFVDAGQPYVIPMNYARMGNRLVLHLSHNSRLYKLAADGADLCVTVTLLDGLVFAKSATHHSVNYRSVVIVGRGCAVRDDDEKMRALRALVNHAFPGRGTRCGRRRRKRPRRPPYWRFRSWRRRQRCAAGCRERTRTMPTGRSGRVRFRFAWRCCRRSPRSDQMPSRVTRHRFRGPWRSTHGRGLSVSIRPGAKSADEDGVHA